jgi:hypothetical protein
MTLTGAMMVVDHKVVVVGGGALGVGAGGAGAREGRAPQVSRSCACPWRWRAACTTRQASSPDALLLPHSPCHPPKGPHRVRHVAARRDAGLLDAAADGDGARRGRAAAVQPDARGLLQGGGWGKGVASRACDLPATLAPRAMPRQGPTPSTTRRPTCSMSCAPCPGPSPPTHRRSWATSRPPRAAAPAPSCTCCAPTACACR